METYMAEIKLICWLTVHLPSILGYASVKANLGKFGESRFRACR